MIRSHQESPLRAVAEKLANERGEAQTFMEHTPVEVSGARNEIGPRPE